MELVLQAHKSLAYVTNSEVILCEGAGSCSELNLMERDVVNLPLVRRLGCPWLLVSGASIFVGGEYTGERFKLKHDMRDLDRLGSSGLFD